MARARPLMRGPQMSRRRLAGVVMACLALAQPLQAQVPGHGYSASDEVGTNLYQNTRHRRRNTVLTAIAAAETAANTILDLTPLDEIITLQGIIEDVKVLADIMAQVEGLSNDVASLRAQIAALFGLETAPASTSALQERLAEIRRVRAQCYSYAMRLQTLMTTAIRTIEHLTALLTSVSTFLGAKQGMQTLVQVNMTISKTLTIQTTQTAAFQRAESVDKMEELLTIESLHRINEAMMADWPRRR